MSYLKFEKAQMANLQESMCREVLRTNRSGAYAYRTVVDCNTRKYHGLLVAPIPEMDDDNHVLLSSLDATVVQHGAEFNLGVHKYQSGVFSPNGHKYIREFSLETIPTTLYRVGGVILKREIIFQAYNTRVLVRYTLVDCHSSTILRFKPFLAFRSVKTCMHENTNIIRDYQEVDGGIKTHLYEGYPDLYMQFSRKCEFIFQPDWYRGLLYDKELERGYEGVEDLYVPGYFEVSAKKGDQIIFAAGLEEVKPNTLKKVFDQEVKIRTPRDNFYHTLVNSAHQFHMRVSDKERYLLAGYPWFKVRARDMFISLPGLTIAIQENDYFKLVMDTAKKAIYEFMSGRPLTGLIREIEQPDVLLWAIWALQQYAHEVGNAITYQEYGKFLEDMLRFMESGKHPNLELKENGLMHIEGRDEPMTWMNSTVNGKPVVPRTGYVVEINALWYNALKFCAEMAISNGKPEMAAELDARADIAKDSFQKIFVNPNGYLFDYVEEGITDWSVRPNMIFPVAFDYSPLEPEQKKSVLDFCTRELLTPKGLRTLSPKSGGYNPIYAGAQTQRDYAYHSGTAWPWLGGFYMEACIKVYKRTRLSFVQRQMLGYEDEMQYHVVGSISELFDGNPPYHGRGAGSFAMNVAEILRTWRLIDQYKV